MPPPDLHPATQALLDRLAAEERAVLAAAGAADALHADLRRGATTDHRPALEAAAEALHAAAAARAAAARELASALELPSTDITLAALAGRLPADVAAPLWQARDRLAAAAGRLTEIQQRNAKLASHLRSYFHGVMSALTPAAPEAGRYGRSGTPLAGPAGRVFRGSG